MAIPPASTRLARDLWNAWRQSMPMHQVSYEAHGEPVIDFETGLITTLGTTTIIWMLLEAYRLDEIDGVRVITTDQRGFLWTASLAVPVTLLDRVVIDDLTWSVVTVEPFMGGAITKLQLRREEDPSA